MNKIFSIKGWRRGAVISGALFAFFLSGKQLALSQSATINDFLNVQTSKTVDSDDGEEVDSEYFKSDYSSTEEVKEFCDSVGKEVAQEGVVLLKNENNALPLSKGDKVSLLGQGAVNPNYASSGSSAASGVTYPDFADAFEEAGLSVNQTALNFYRTGAGSSYGRNTNYVRALGSSVYFVNECPYSEYDSDTIASIESYGDAAIVNFCRDSGEGSDISTSYSDGEDGSYLSLTEEERSLLVGLTALKAEGKISKIIVMLNMAVIMETDFLFDDTISVDACLWIGNVGTNGIYGVTDVLMGNVNPSGHLNDTFLRDNFSSPAMASWSLNDNLMISQKYTNYSDYSLGSSQRNYIAYTEGIYVGYRYYETRYEDTILQRSNVGDFSYSDVVSYPFGYGLSYTTFEYSDFAVAEGDDTFTVSLKVTNTGDVDGKDAVQIYMQKPYSSYDIEKGVEKASVELVGYTKTSTIKSGESEEVSIVVDKEEMKSYDSNGAGTYILSEGEYYLTAASDSHDAVNNILASKGYSTANGMDAEGDASLAKVVLDNPTLDTETYANSLETGNKIENQLDFMDINRYENKGDNSVTYVTRNNWTGTWPETNVSLSVSGDAMAYDLSSDKEVVDDGSELPTYGASNGLSLIDLKSSEENEIAYDDEKWDLLLDQMSFADQENLITNSAFNTPSIESVQKPQTNDHDGPTGLDVTTTSTVMPSLGIQASTYNDELIQKVGDALAEDCRLAGYQTLYAPGVNIHRTPFGGRHNEYYSEDPFLTGSACSAFVTGMQNKGVLATIKHFAFNNEDTDRSGVCVWMNEQEAREINLKPFEMALRPSKGNGHAIMTSFNRAGCIWTSASEELMTDILRDEWGFDGYSITDMASSNGASYMLYADGIMAGTDLWLGSDVSGALSAYQNNAAFANRMREACHRVLYTIANYSCAMNGVSSSTRIISVTPWWETLINVLEYVSLGVMIASIGMYVASLVMYAKDGESETEKKAKSTAQ